MRNGFWRKMETEMDWSGQGQHRTGISSNRLSFAFKNKKRPLLCFVTRVERARGRERERERERRNSSEATNNVVLKSGASI